MRDPELARWPVSEGDDLRFRRSRQVPGSRASLVHQRIDPRYQARAPSCGNVRRFPVAHRPKRGTPARTSGAGQPRGSFRPLQPCLACRNGARSPSETGTRGISDRQRSARGRDPPAAPAMGPDRPPIQTGTFRRPATMMTPEPGAATQLSLEQALQAIKLSPFAQFVITHAPELTRHTESGPWPISTSEVFLTALGIRARLAYGDNGTLAEADPKEELALNTIAERLLGPKTPLSKNTSSCSHPSDVASMNIIF